MMLGKEIYEPMTKKKKVNLFDKDGAGYIGPGKKMKPDALDRAKGSMKKAVAKRMSQRK